MGVAWDELPAIALHSSKRANNVYPRGKSFEFAEVKDWLARINLQRDFHYNDNYLYEAAQAGEGETGMYVQRDATIYENFLESTIDISLKDFYA